MGQRHCIAFWLSVIQDQKSLTLRWHSVFGGTKVIVVSISANQGGRQFDYGIKPLHSHLIIQDGRQELLMLCWCSLLGGSSNIVTTIITHEGGQYYNYGSIIAYTGLSRRRRCLVQPEAEMSCTVGDRDVLYSRRRRWLVWPETEMSRIAGDDGWLW